MNPQLRAMTGASPYRNQPGNPPERPNRGDAYTASNTNTPASHWPVLVYDGESWVCIGHGQETAQQAENMAWALEQVDMLSVGNIKNGTLAK